MRINSTNRTTLTMNNETIEEIEEFQYLGIENKQSTRTGGVTFGENKKMYLKMLKHTTY